MFLVLMFCFTLFSYFIVLGIFSVFVILVYVSNLSSFYCSFYSYFFFLFLILNTCLYYSFFLIWCNYISGLEISMGVFILKFYEFFVF